MANKAKIDNTDTPHFGNRKDMFNSFPPNHKNSIRFQIYESLSSLFQMGFNFLINYGEPYYKYKKDGQ